MSLMTNSSRSILYFAIILCLARGEKENEEPGSKLSQLTPWNFGEKVGGDKHVLTIFYAPWCGGCKKFMPKYVETARMLQGLEDLAVMKSDVTEFDYEELKGRLNVSKVPAMKLFKKGSTAQMHVVPQEPFEMHFAIKEALGYPVPNKCMFGDSDAEAVTSSTWDKIVMDPTQSVLVKFYAPWCSHCKKFSSVFNTIARKLMVINGVKAVRVNADDSKELMEKYGVKRLPTLMVFSKKNKNGTVYPIPDANEHLEMINKVILRMQQPESDPGIEEDAKAVLVTVKEMQKEGRITDAIAKLSKIAATKLNVTEVWRTSLLPLQNVLRETEALRLKNQASDIAGEGNFGPALEILQKVLHLYGDTAVVKSEAFENLHFNCKEMLRQAQSKSSK